MPTVKHGDGNIMIWGCFASIRTGRLEIIEEKVNSKIYRQILTKNLLDSKKDLKLKSGWLFQQDNNPKHTEATNNG